MAIGSEEFDVSSMVDSAASSMKLDDVDETPEIEPVEEEPLEESDEPAEEPVEETEETEEPEGEEQPQARQAPKSWSKDQHAVWSKLPSEAQNYIEVREKQMLDGIEEYKEFAHYGRELNNVINPYMPMFEAANVDIKTGVQYLLNAQYLLQHGSLEQKTSELKRIAEQYGVNLQNNAESNAQPIDPTVQELQNKLNELTNTFKQREKAAYEQTRSMTRQEVDSFANDGKHPYFEEVGDDIANFIKLGQTLENAYQQAVWKNPVTMEKEIARLQTEANARMKEKRKLEANAALKATSSNVRTIDTTRTPTETKGKLFSKEHDAEMESIVSRGYSRT